MVFMNNWFEIKFPHFTANICMAAISKVGCDWRQWGRCKMGWGNENRKMSTTHRTFINIKGFPLRSLPWWCPASSEGCKRFWWPGVHQWVPWWPEGKVGQACGRSCAGGALFLWGWSSEAVKQKKSRWYLILKR